MLWGHANPGDRNAACSEAIAPASGEQDCQPTRIATMADRPAQTPGMRTTVGWGLDKRHHGHVYIVVRYNEVRYIAKPVEENTPCRPSVEAPPWRLALPSRSFWRPPSRLDPGRLDTPTVHS